MLATRVLPSDYHAWNARWHAPQGPDGTTYLASEEGVSRRRGRALGPFVWQPNSSTRAFEYPWAFFEIAPRKGLRVLEIGGGLSGLQFVVATEGAHVVNVDPMQSYGRESYSAGAVARHAYINRLWGTDVELRTTNVEEAGLAVESFDVVTCISTLEHLAEPDVISVLAATKRLLVPGGRLVVSTDLFLNLAPFSTRLENEWGTNISMEWLVAQSGLALEKGRREELLGFPEFDPQQILARLEDFAVSSAYPQMAQVLTLCKAPG
ncbi:MAG: class I SAM-dependent methyltransferase [Acidimicrobiales bacterium]